MSVFSLEKKGGFDFLGIFLRNGWMEKVEITSKSRVNGDLELASWQILNSLTFEFRGAEWNTMYFLKWLCLLLPRTGNDCSKDWYLQKIVGYYSSGGDYL